MVYINSEGNPVANIFVNSDNAIDFSAEPIGSDENYKFSKWLNNEDASLFFNFHRNVLKRSALTFNTCAKDDFDAACKLFGWKASEDAVA